MGIGGIFFRAKDPKALSEWYSHHLGLKISDNVALFGWNSPVKARLRGQTVWALFPKDSDYFPKEVQFMVNYRVKDLKKVISALKKEGAKVIAKTESSQYGKFGWVFDPEGNRIELWEPPPRSKFSEEENLME